MAERDAEGQGGDHRLSLWPGPRGPGWESILKHAVYMPIRIGNTFWSIVVATPERRGPDRHVGIQVEIPAHHPRPARLLHDLHLPTRQVPDHHPRAEEARTHRQGAPGERGVVPAHLRRVVRPHPAPAGQCLRRVQPRRPGAAGEYPARSPHRFHAGGHLAAATARRLPVGQSCRGKRCGKHTPAAISASSGSI